MNTKTQTKPKGKATPEVARDVCPNCQQWQNWTQFGYYDCFHGCAERGFAPKHPTPGNAPRDNKSEHSSLPWTFSAIGGDNLIMAKGVPVAEVLYDEAQERISIEEMDANKAFIVRACNNAERLAEALRVLLSRAQDLDQSATDSGLRNCEALAKARGALAQWEAAQ
jgi:hypothetical protein